MLFDVLKKDRIQAMKDKDSVKKDLLSTLIGEASKEEKTPDDKKVIATIKKFIGVFDKSIAEMKEKGIEPPQALLDEKASTEKILNPYLPQQLSEDAIKVAVNAAITLGATNMGGVMKYMKDNFEGRYDGAVASKIAKELLA